MGYTVLEELLPQGLPARWAALVGTEGLESLARIGRNIDKNPGQKALLTPEPELILRAFDTPPQSVRALIVGQDPYPGAGHASGLAFSVAPRVSPLPPSLRNIRQEYLSDLGLALPDHGDLSAWAHNGVFLLNRHLTSLVGSPGAHRHLGWSTFTDRVVSGLVASGQEFVSILWGREAAELTPLLMSLPRIESPHPSPLSARLGFFGSKPFSRANRLLEDSGHPPIDWALDRVV
jgi:uracil-DNA glycosylase